MKFIKNVVTTILISSMLVTSQVSYAAFGSKSFSSGSKSFGVSRSYSRPSTSSAPKQSYSPPKTSYSSSASTGNTYRPNTNYNNYPRQNSALRDIGVTAAGVAGGVLAAEAISGLIRGPGGMYTHPSYPGQYFNAQGAAIPQEAVQQNLSGQTQPQTTIIYQQPENDSGLFPFWGFVGGLIEFFAVVLILAGIAFGCYRLFWLIKSQYKKEKVKMICNIEEEFENLDATAMEIFYNFQTNSDNKDWVKRNTKYLDVNKALSEPSSVVSYEHKTLDVSIEQGKLRGSVKYKAVVENDRLEGISQIWNFEKDQDIWKLIGIEN